MEHHEGEALFTPYRVHKYTLGKVWNAKRILAYDAGTRTPAKLSEEDMYIWNNTLEKVSDNIARLEAWARENGYLSPDYEKSVAEYRAKWPQYCQPLPEYKLCKYCGEIAAKANWDRTCWQCHDKIVKAENQ